MAHPNEELLRRQDEAFNNGDFEGVLDTFTDDVVVHVMGRSKLSGDYKGRGQMAEVLGKFVAIMGESAVFETHDILANGEHGVVLQRFTGERGGERSTFTGVAIFHFRDGKVSEAWFVDTDPYAADPWYDAAGV